MTKIIIMVTIFLIILSLYLKNKKIIKLRNILVGLALISICSNFSIKSLENIRVNYLYTAKDFEQYVELAQKSMRDYGVYASLTLAQAANEQGLVPTTGYSLFGVKAGKGWKGDKFNSITEEQDTNGNSSTIVDAFRAYDSIADSFDNHGYFMVNEFGNRKEFNKATTLEEQIISLQSNPVAMYGTDVNYLCKLVSIINKYDLTKYDVGVTFEGRGIKIVGEHNPNLSIGNCKIVGNNSSSSSSSSNNSYIVYKPETTYEGVYKEGYLFERLKIDANNYDLLSTKLESGEADKIISEIYGRVVKGLNYHGNSNSSGEIIGNVGTIGSIDAGPYSTWRQGDSRWGAIKIGITSKSISGIGCAVTSVAIQIARSGVALASSFVGNFNPGSFVQALNSINGFTEEGGIYWGKATSIAPQFGFYNKIPVNKNNSLSTIASYLQDSNNYLIVHVNGSNNRKTSNHWVAVTGVTNNDVYMIDPASESTSLDATYGIEYIDTIVIYKVS